MLVSKKHRKVVLNLSNPDRVLAVIPTAKDFVYKGRRLVAVPHKVEEVRVLRNLGIDAPAPITTYYNWPGRYDAPFEHQKHMSEFMVLNPRSFNLGDMGTGKTLATLWAYHYLRSIGAVRKVLIVSPLSTLERTWGDEIFSNFSDLSFGVVHGTRERRLQILAQDHDIYLLNHDGVRMPAVLDALLAMDGLDVLVIDECAVFRNAGTERWKGISKLAKKVPYVWGLTGTPTPNEPTDAWAQVRLINPSNVPNYAGKFKDQVMRKVSTFKWVAKDDAHQTVLAAMQPSIRYKREECIDLPPTTYQTRQVELSDEQRRVYNDMARKLKAEVANGQITAVNAAVKANKLLQIACGAAYGVGKEEIILPAKPRMDVVREIVEQSGGKVIVFVPIVLAVEEVARQLAKDYTVAVIHGKVSKGERDQIFSSFQKTEHPQVLVAQPATMSHGLTLVAASTIVWFAPTTSNEVYEQACARIVRPGQKRNTLIVHIEGTHAERRMYDRLRNKGESQGTLLDLFAEERDER